MSIQDKTLESISMTKELSLEDKYLKGLASNDEILEIESQALEEIERLRQNKTDIGESGKAFLKDIREVIKATL